MFKDSPVEQLRKDGDNGNADWMGYVYVYRQISDACEAMGLSKEFRGNQFHVESMADLGSGHEERMKYRMMLLREYGWM